MPTEPMPPMSVHDEVVELYSRYGWACDTRDWDLLRSCFASDVTVQYVGFSEAYEGYDALEHYLRHALEPLDGTQHMFSNFVVQVNDDIGTFRCHMRAQHILHGAENGQLFEVAGTYHCKIRLVDGAWKITELNYQPTWWQGNPAVLAHIMDDAGAPMPGRPQNVA